jgi:hypothetical protein
VESVGTTWTPRIETGNAFTFWYVVARGALVVITSMTPKSMAAGSTLPGRMAWVVAAAAVGIGMSSMAAQSATMRLEMGSRMGGSFLAMRRTGSAAVTPLAEGR